MLCVRIRPPSVRGTSIANTQPDENKAYILLAEARLACTAASSATWYLQAACGSADVAFPQRPLDGRGPRITNPAKLMQ